MKKASAVLFAAFVALSGAVHAKTSTPAGWTDDYDAALAQAAAEQKLVLADFSGSDWCCWCQRLDKEVFGTEEFRRVATNRYVLLMVDSPGDQSLLSEKAKKQNPTLVEKFGVRGFPSVFILDAKGEVLFRTGYQEGGPKKYLEMLDAEVKDAPDVNKYIKPIEAVLNEYDEAMNKEMREIGNRLEEKYPELPPMATPEARERRGKEAMAEGQRIMFEEIAVKYIPIYEKAFAKAKEMKVPAHMESRKNDLISEQERRFNMFKEAAEKYRAEKARPSDGR